MAPLFFFGAMSPYSWFAAERIERLLPEAQWRGVLAGAIFKANGRVSWGLTERRGEGIADCERRAALYGLGRIRWPRPWPTSDLLIARALIFAATSGAPRAPAPVAPGEAAGAPTSEIAATGETRAAGEHGVAGRQRPLALAAMRLAFLEGADLADPRAVLEAGRRSGIDERELEGALYDPVVKDALRSATDEALALGVFGVPTIAIGRELFWGDDRLEEAVRAHRSSDRRQRGGIGS
jgi:2-hydroxychromene-2-carboxylate isomerase